MKHVLIINFEGGLLGNPAYNDITGLLLKNGVPIGYSKYMGRSRHLPESSVEWRLALELMEAK